MSITADVKYSFHVYPEREFWNKSIQIAVNFSMCPGKKVSLKLSLQQVRTEGYD